MSNKEPIRGKVARILNSRELAMNIGTKDGVSVGHQFDVLDAKAEDIKDPDSGEVLGSVQRPKVRVRVTSVQERLSVAETFRERQVNVGGTGIGLSGYSGYRAISDMLTPPKYISKTESLKTQEKTWEDLDESQSFVKTGDPVIQVLDVTKPF